MKELFTILCCCLTTIAFTQKQANIWHFGNGRALDFSTGTPVNVNGSQISTFEGSASYCNQYGSFLFYTNGGGREPAYSGQDGGHIWNRNNVVMYDMHGIEGGGFSSSQSAVIFEAPGEDSVYYVFTMDEYEYNIGASPAIQAAQPLGRGLRYFKVDMRLNGGLGAAVVANQPVKIPSSEGLCAIRHSNKRDYWVLINQDSAGIGVYSVHPGGVSFTGVFPVSSPGPIKGAPNGTKVGLDSKILNFNNSTGQLSSPVTLSGSSAYCEFSPDSRFLYALRRAGSFNASLVRYDLQSANVDGSATVISPPAGLINVLPGQLQLAADGKIYFTTLNPQSSTVFVNRINCPNTFSASVEQNVFTYSSPGIIFYGLPNFPGWLFENNDLTYVSLGPDTISLCNVGGSFLLNAGNPGASYLWSTGATTQTITVHTPGTYSVTVSNSCGTGTDQMVVIECGLPLQFINFTGNNTGRAVRLYWETMNEENVSHFTIQQSSDGTTFTNMGKVAADNKVQNSYQYLDILTGIVQNKVLFYRIECADKDGKKSYSAIISIHFNNRFSALNIYPNPTRDFIIIESESAEHISIFNSLGQIIQQVRNVATQQKIDIRQFIKGIYFIKCTDRNGLVIIRKLIVE